ncbi:phenylalanine--tRNA ligase subunit alpha [Sphingobacteriaceae bacterium AH-315-L07]|nr:phenylalanine--tRNA ligase subunit alpha [Bacteroidia bacterium]MBN4052241.1 phenylalanine--tRNA ligase subunit alpha [Sphingobacteriaceae bacterium AH-315-L07]
MVDEIKKFLEEIEDFDPKDKNEVEDFRIRYMGKKGIMAELFAGLKNVETDNRKEVGQQLNLLKNKAQQKIDELNVKFEQAEITSSDVDLSLPAEPLELGARHPVSIVHNEIVNIFSRIGFTISEGPEIEDDWHNFTALNTPENHPARDMQDTFYVEKDPDVLLRTHTSSVQIRVMESEKPPIRTISPGRCYRNETISARAHCFFHQFEGLYIDENVSFADLKQTLYYFAQEFFGENTDIKFRPSFFPFTEPSAEMDISCNICKGEGCKVCKHTGWLEILGCGMVDPNVLENCKIDSKKYSGFAFGMGIERIAMLKFQIDDIRVLFENDVRFLKQFKSAII